MYYGGPSAPAIAWNGRLQRRGHDDGHGGEAPARACALLWLTKLEQRTREKVIGCWGASGATAVKNGRLVASLRRLWRRRSEEALGCCCGEGKGPRQRENGVRLSAGGRWRDEGAPRRGVACAVRATATRGQRDLHAAALF